MKNEKMRNEKRMRISWISGIASLGLLTSALSQTPPVTQPPEPAPVAEEDVSATPESTEVPIDAESATPAPAPTPVAPRPAPSLPSVAPQPPGADEFLPPSYEPRRYASSWSNSPFEREILPPIVIPVEEKNELDEYRVVGIGKLRGKYLITLNHPKEGYKNVEEDPKSDEIYVLSVSNGTNPQEAKVRIKRGNMEAEITFDEKNLKSTAKGGAAAPPQARQQSNPRLAVPNRGTQPAAPNPAVKSSGNQALINHLKQSTQKPAASGTTNSGTTPAPAPKRRRVVLPPSR